MLLNDLFIVDNWQAGNGTLSALIHMQVPHRIFDGIVDVVAQHLRILFAGGRAASASGP